LLLAAYGCSGVNMETGVNQLGFVSFYSPIGVDDKGRTIAGPSYYGMRAFAAAAAGCKEVLPVEFDAQGADVTVYVLGVEGKARTAVAVNRDQIRDARLSLKGLGMKRGFGLRLAAASADSKTGITFGGSGVDEDGRWQALSREPLAGEAIAVPRMSAVVLRWDS
jgi:hypothetical protein